MLCFLHDHHLSFGHHRIASGRIDHGHDVRIRTIQDGLVELPLFFLQNRLGNIFRNLVNIIGFLSHQIVYRLINLIPQITDNFFVCRLLRHSCLFNYHSYFKCLTVRFSSMIMRMASIPIRTWSSTKRSVTSLSLASVFTPSGIMG